jgi:(p)ppGpp synthase/HD superfamily hydrolase
MAGGSFMNQHLVPVAILGMEYHEIEDPHQIVAYLSHDAIEDFRKYIFRYTVAATFGEKAARLVWGATKPRRTILAKRSVEYLKSVVAQVETGGEECVFMKCNADRLHNMITLWGTPAKKSWKIWETEQLYVPLARKYGFPVGELQLAIKEQRQLLHIKDV